MNKLLFTLLLIFIDAETSSAQDVYKLESDTSSFKNAPSYIIKRRLKDPVQASTAVIDPQDIDSVNVYKYPHNNDINRQSPHNDVIEFVLKNGWSLMSYNDLLTKYNITNATENLPVYVDSTITRQPEKSYYEAAIIKYVKIEVEPGTGMKYVSIRTVFPIRRKKDHVHGAASDIKISN